MKTLPFIAFDMDGTLLDTRYDIATAANDARAELGLSAMSVDDVVKAVGDGVNLFVSRVTFPESHPEFKKARKVFLKHYALNATGQTKPYPGVEDLLVRLHKNGFPMGVISNKPWNLVDLLVKHLNWQSYFSTWIGGDTADAAKPSPLPLWLALKNSGLERAHPMVLIGDGHQDILAAQNAGVSCYWCSWGFNAEASKEAPSIRVDSVQDVIFAIENQFNLVVQ